MAKLGDLLSQYPNLFLIVFGIKDRLGWTVDESLPPRSDQMQYIQVHRTPPRADKTT